MNAATSRRILVMVSILHGATHLYTTFLQPLNSDLKAFFHLTLDRDITIVSTVFLIFYALANLAAGFLVNRFEPRTLLAFGPTLNGFAVMGMYLLTPEHYYGLLALTALGASGGGLYHPVGGILLARTFPDSKGRALGISGACACIAFIAAPITAAEFVGRGICSWQTICLAYGALGVCCGIAAWLFVPAGFPSHSSEQRVLTHVPPPGAMEGVATRSVVIFGVFLILAMAGREIASWGTTSITQQFVAATYVNGPSAGLLVAAVFMTGVVVQPLAGKWSDTLGRERVFALAMLGMGVSCFLLPMAPASLVFPAYLLLGTAMSASVPTFEAMLADRTPLRLRGPVFGVVITVGIAIGAIGPFLVGAIADAGLRTPLSYRNGFWALSGLAFVSAIFALGLKPLAVRLGLATEKEKPVPKYVEQSAVVETTTAS